MRAMVSGWKVLMLIITVLISVLLHYEVDNDVLLVEKEVALPVTRAKAFLFLSELKNLKIVSLICAFWTLSIYYGFIIIYTHIYLLTLS